MPKKNIDWSNCAMYRIVCKNPEIKECYVGQSTNLIKRRNKHKSCCTNSNCKEYSYPVYSFIRENGGFDNWEVILIEYYTCNNREEASARERYWKEFYNATLNVYVPGRGQKEYYQHNIDKILEYKKEYYQNNINKILEYNKEYYQNNVDKILGNSKEYYQNNVDKILEQKKEYYQHNAEKRKEYQNQYYIKKKAEKKEDNK